MTFAELLTEVLGWTKRPDLTTQSSSAIRRAILAAHRKEKFWRDRADLLNVAVPAPGQFAAQIDIASTLPQFRQLSYVRISNTDTYLKVVEADELLDADGYALTQIAFLAGTNLNIKHNATIAAVDISYWKDPVVTGSSHASWIATDYPDLIIASAAKNVFAFDNESEIYRAAAIQEVEEWAELIRNNIEPVGR